jgi:hypothetical protein
VDVGRAVVEMKTGRVFSGAWRRGSNLDSLPSST